MNQEDLEKIYKFLDRYVLEKLEYPCDHCGYFECEKNYLNSEDIIKKRYKWNDIDWKHCLKRNKKELKILMDVLRIPEFKKWSNEECAICKKRFFKYDMKLHSETEIEGHSVRLKSGKEQKFFEWRGFRLCKKCNRSYVLRKKPIYEGFKKF